MNMDEGSSQETDRRMTCRVNPKFTYFPHTLLDLNTYLRYGSYTFSSGGKFENLQTRRRRCAIGLFTNAASLWIGISLRLTGRR